MKTTTTDSPTNMMLPMFLPAGKPIVTGLFATLAGWISGSAYIAVLQIPAVPWYEHPAVVSALVTGTFLLALKLYDFYQKNKERKDGYDREEDEIHATLSAKIQELTQQERRELLGGLNSLHNKEVDFLKGQLLKMEVAEYELRERAHAFANEVNRLHSHILGCQMLLATNHIEVPEFQLKHYNQIIDGIPEKVNEFRDTLMKQGGASWPV